MEGISVEGNTNNKVDDKFSKVKKKFGSGKFKVELYKEKSKLNREIDDIQEKKAKIFLEMGILTYQKLEKILLMIIVLINSVMSY